MISVVNCGEPVGSPSNATLVTSEQTTTIGSELVYNCDDEDMVVTSGNLTILCEGDGRWSDNPPVCGTNDSCKIYSGKYNDNFLYYLNLYIFITEKDCGSVPTDFFGNPLSDDFTTTVGSEVVIKCLPGFSAGNIRNNIYTVRCMEDGQWSEPDTDYCGNYYLWIPK